MKLHLRPDYKKKKGVCSKRSEKLQNKKEKKAEGVCLLSVAVIFGEVCRSAFLAIGGAG